MRADGSTAPLRSADPEAERVFDYLRRANLAGGLDTHMERTERDGWACMRFHENAQT
jgi:hypothetical protein